MRRAFERGISKGKAELLLSSNEDNQKGQWLETTGRPLLSEIANYLQEYSFKIDFVDIEVALTLNAVRPEIDFWTPKDYDPPRISIEVSKSGFSVRSPDSDKSFSTTESEQVLEKVGELTVKFLEDYDPNWRSGSGNGCQFCDFKGRIRVLKGFFTVPDRCPRC